MTELQVSAIIPVFNRISTLRQSLNSVVEAARACADVEIILVDHSSTDGSYEVLLEVPGATVLRCSGGEIASVRNYGARHARGELLCFLDCDIVVPKEYFSTLRRVFAETGAEAVGCEVGLPDRPHWVEKIWYDANVRRGDGFRHYINSGNFAVRRSAFEQVGGFPEELKTGEDTEICRRLRNNGFRIYESQALSVAHLGNPKSLGAFFRKQVWHGLGASGGRPFRTPDKPTIMTGLYIGCILLALLTLLLPIRSGLWARLSGAGLLLALVPGATLLYRMREVRRGFSVPRALLIFFVFYAARAVALTQIIFGRMDERRAPSSATVG